MDQLPFTGSKSGTVILLMVLYVTKNSYANIDQHFPPLDVARWRSFPGSFKNNSSAKNAVKRHCACAKLLC